MAEGKSDNDDGSNNEYEAGSINDDDNDNRDGFHVDDNDDDDESKGVLTSVVPSPNSN